MAPTGQRTTWRWVRRLQPIRLMPTLAFCAAWLVPWQPVFSAHSRSGLTFFAHRRDALGRHIAKYGEHEPGLTRWIETHLASSPAGIVIDIGANIGWHALHAARCANVESVVAFEPDLFNAWLFERNCLANGVDNVLLSVTAVGARRGTLKLYRYKSSNLMRHSAAVDFSFGARRVPVVDLDSALDDFGLGEKPISLVKIDVEGFEPAVIEGAVRSLRRARAVVLEFQPALYRAAGLSAETMIERMRAHGFSPFVLSASGSPVAADLARNLQSQITDDIVWLRQDAQR